MKAVLLQITGNLVAMICAGGAVYLAIFDKPGWGWFLFVAVITCVWYNSQTSSKREKCEEKRPMVTFESRDE